LLKNYSLIENYGCMNKVSGLEKRDTRKIPPKTPAITPVAK